MIAVIRPVPSPRKPAAMWFVQRKTPAATQVPSGRDGATARNHLFGRVHHGVTAEPVDGVAECLPPRRLLAFGVRVTGGIFSQVSGA